MSSDTWLYFSSVFAGQLSRRCCNIGRELGGIEVGLASFTYCLGGCHLAYNNQLFSLPSSVVRHVVWGFTILQCYCTAVTLSPGWCTSVGSWKGQWDVEGDKYKGHPNPGNPIGALWHNYSCSYLMILINLKVPWRNEAALHFCNTKHHRPFAITPGWLNSELIPPDSNPFLYSCKLPWGLESFLGWVSQGQTGRWNSCANDLCRMCCQDKPVREGWRQNKKGERGSKQTSKQGGNYEQSSSLNLLPRGALECELCFRVGLPWSFMESHILNLAKSLRGLGVVWWVRKNASPQPLWLFALSGKASPEAKGRVSQLRPYESETEGEMGSGKDPRGSGWSPSSICHRNLVLVLFS